jgi:hypothetical protein
MESMRGKETEGSKRAMIVAPPQMLPQKKLGLAISANPLISLVGRRGLEPQT